MVARTALRIGLTGGIGSGKSTVATLLAELGAAVVDTDLIARQLAATGGAAIPALQECFGPALIDTTGALDRTRMRDLVFANPDAKLRLEAILHPMIGAETERQANAATAPVVVFDVPLLVESGRWAMRVDGVWVVDCREATQQARVSARPSWSELTVRAVMSQQATRAKRRAHADAVIYNDDIGLDALASRVQSLWKDCIAHVA